MGGCKIWLRDEHLGKKKLADNKGLPKVERITEKMSRRWGPPGGTVVIPAPKEVDEIMREVPEGNVDYDE